MCVCLYYVYFINYLFTALYIIDAFKCIKYALNTQAYIMGISFRLPVLQP